MLINAAEVLVDIIKFLISDTCNLIVQVHLHMHASKSLQFQLKTTLFTFQSIMKWKILVVLYEGFEMNFYRENSAFDKEILPKYGGWGHSSKSWWKNFVIYRWNLDFEDFFSRVEQRKHFGMPAMSALLCVNGWPLRPVLECLNTVSVLISQYIIRDRR